MSGLVGKKGEEGVEKGMQRGWERFYGGSDGVMLGRKGPLRVKKDG